MEIKKIDGLSPQDAKEYLEIPISEIRKLFGKIFNSYNTNLKEYGVKSLWKDEFDLIACSDSEFIENIDVKALQLIFLYKYILIQIHSYTNTFYTNTFYTNTHLYQYTLIQISSYILQTAAPPCLQASKIVSISLITRRHCSGFTISSSVPSSTPITFS